MPKKKKSSKNASNTSGQTISKRDVVFKTDMEEYGKITKLLGNSRLIIMLPDGGEIMGIIPGRFRKRCWMAVNDIVLVSKREFQERKVDVVHRYEKDEPHRLFTLGEIPSFFVDGTSTENDTGVFIVEEDEADVIIPINDIDFDDI